MRRFGILVCSVLLGIGLLGTAPVYAVVVQPDRVPLTLDLLQERLRNPVQSEGVRIIDLRRMVIDLRSENGSLREPFYRLLQAQLQRPGTVIGLDLSYSLIEGDLEGSQLGLRTPLYGQALAPLFTPAEQAQLQRDRRRLSQLSQLSRSLLITPNSGATAPVPLQITVFRGPLKLVQTQFRGSVNFTNTFFLNRLEAQGATFAQDADWSESRFSQPTSFAGSFFQREARFRGSLFFAKAGFTQTQFQGRVSFQGSEFQSTANFNQAWFQQPVNLTRVQWQGTVDFAQAHWQEQVLFNKAKFNQALFLTEATFDKAVAFREAQFNQPVNLRGATILDQADFSDAGFAGGSGWSSRPRAYLNVAGLNFNLDHAKILGNPGQIGQVLSVPTLQGNETLLRNLVRNFRELEQIADANQVEYTTEKLRLRELSRRIVGTNLNTAPPQRLRTLGLAPAQATEILQKRAQQAFRSPTDLLSLNSIDLATYLNLRDRVIVSEPRSFGTRILDGFHWLGLSLLLLLSRYGTSFWLVFGVGMIAIAVFGLLFWLVDRCRRLHPQPITPTVPEGVAVLLSFATLTVLGTTAIVRTTDQPGLTLACLALVILPIPSVMLILLYQRGRYHNLMTTSYLVEDATLRQLRLLIGRLPVIPRFPLFRDRYMPLLWDRRWNWLNYYDFSLNNLIKLGFNDIRLRDEHLPSLITGLVWYQWSLGILYIALLLWTLSRTIPGLNLLIYFR